MAHDQLDIEDQPSDEDIQFLESRIYEYNVASTDVDDGRPLSVIIRGGDERVAGLFGHTWGGVFEVKTLWVREELRGRGLGKRLLAAAEEEARRRGCSRSILETHSFQAPDFYFKLGYTVYGVVDNYPPGHQKLYLKKRLA
jgi:GNAT superfamily N-acetyltransferase